MDRLDIYIKGTTLRGGVPGRSISMTEKELERLIERAGKALGHGEGEKTHILEYSVDFGTVVMLVKLSVN